MSTGNVERIESELKKAVQAIPERADGYRDSLVTIAMECILDTIQHDEAPININQRYDKRLKEVGAILSTKGQL